jgi:hypothetical protein
MLKSSFQELPWRTETEKGIFVEELTSLDNQLLYPLSLLLSTLLGELRRTLLENIAVLVRVGARLAIVVGDKTELNLFRDQSHFF